ncbi:hypothetical protein L226DRAFT_458933 [Lentinus tigrinus ALCF2SS1-7]|uniref:Uncharacterized protein n=1 Tax=Lentinus tigrinus ALCF2SS1-6 TaxID=1328759 RepID=A0A5C2SFX1_9APHY|nr:hypothetical protein L227DRAFT_498191 [Lentinus tigrinus ALCF2SS1-6]RPD77566.1 hypothetical protein L226DRAFT_458933 [Lentinus tigrinus ALCF2SS1-7]
MDAPAPSAESLAHRARLAKLVSELRPTRFRAPLTRLLAHRIPTLWTLYRGILRDAPTETIRSRMRAFFHNRKALRAQGDVTRELRKAHKWWDVFRKARAGDAHLQAVCARYSRMLEGAQAQARADRVYEEELAWYERMRTRPIMTGAYLRPSLFNGPLPRLVPQPLHITGMITYRRKARERRMARHEILQEDLALLNLENHFERSLAAKEGTQLTPVFTDDFNAWREPIKRSMDDISRSFEREKARLQTPYPPEMLEAIKEARREKIRNKTREGERERRGEMTNRLMKRMRQGPPPHVLAMMTDEQRRMDRIARGASEVGYVGQVKRRLGFRLKDGEAGKVEMGQPENREALDRLAEQIALENERRRANQADA